MNLCVNFTFIILNFTLTPTKKKICDRGFFRPPADLKSVGRRKLLAIDFYKQRFPFILKIIIVCDLFLLN